MIKAEFTKVNGHYTSYTLSGHAGYAEHGKDIVCASVSSLYIAVSNGLTPWMGESLENPDKSSCTLKSFDEKSDLLIETLLNGLKDISEQYPANVQVSLKEDWDRAQEDNHAQLQRESAKLVWLIRYAYDQAISEGFNKKQALEVALKLFEK